MWIDVIDLHSLYIAWYGVYIQVKPCITLIVQSCIFTSNLQLVALCPCPARSVAGRLPHLVIAIQAFVMESTWMIWVKIGNNPSQKNGWFPQKANKALRSIGKFRDFSRDLLTEKHHHGEQRSIFYIAFGLFNFWPWNCDQKWWVIEQRWTKILLKKQAPLT